MCDNNFADVMGDNNFAHVMCDNDFAHVMGDNNFATETCFLVGCFLVLLPGLVVYGLA